MNHYAILENTRIVGVVKTAGPYPGGTLLEQPWTSLDRPSEHHVAHLIDGAVTWVESRTTGEAWADARRQRDAMLAASDWVTVRAVEQGQAVPAPWSAYRQALRDITSQPDPFNISWPAAPG